MRLPFTEKDLLNWSGNRVFRDGRAMFVSGRVEQVEFDPPFVRGRLTYGTRGIQCEFKVLNDGSAENKCPCHNSTERGIICPHVIALGMELIRRKTDPERERKAEEERRKAVRLAAIAEKHCLKRAQLDSPNTVAAELLICLQPDWKDQFLNNQEVTFHILLFVNETYSAIDQADREQTYGLSTQDENLLFVLEEIAEGAVPGVMHISARDVLNIFKLHTGKPIPVFGTDKKLTCNPTPLESRITLDLDRENGELLLFLHTEIPFAVPGRLPTYLIAGKEGWIFDNDNCWPLQKILPGPLQSIYNDTIAIPRPSVPNFFNTELPLIETCMPVETDITPDMFFISPAEPEFELEVRGSPASLSAILWARYADIRLVAGKADAAGCFALPDPDDLLSYEVRNPEREKEAVQALNYAGLYGDCGDELQSIIGTREVMNFLGQALPRLRRMGWTISMQGRVQSFFDEADFITPVVHIDSAEQSRWFDVGFSYENRDGSTLSEAEIQRAILKGDSFIERNGRTILFDSDAIEQARDVFQDCIGMESQAAGRFQLDRIYSAYVQSSLDSLDGIDVETPPTWQRQARRQNRAASLEPFPLNPKQEHILRPYQKEGVYWLRFLENNFLHGILADDMGLGKTLQTLTWLALERTHEDARNKPTLIVCPTSLIENWQEEAHKWTPHLRVTILSGAQRHEHWEMITRTDLVITSYALMRRDIDQHETIEYAAIVLDEAQHIKNRSTQNALAAKRLKGLHRLVLTGTPLENSVADLWSIVDFLMPRYLGHHKTFRERYELPIAAGGPDGDFAQSKLRRKIHPFLLRRIKKDVAKDLPEKIQRIATCTLSPDQQMVYKQLLERSKQKISNLVMREGFNRARMQILKTLLQLRQTCCHLDLLKLPELNSSAPSAKMNLFFELVEEAVDGNHRILVFSQFTTMLGILRQEMEKRDLKYCYLDGSTKNRLSIVKTFNSDRSIPVFLISLKAGGTGLNLVGADTVIHYDPWWNPAVEEQATDRAYRIGQTRTVYNIKLITKGTVEEKVLQMQKKKAQVIEATLRRDEKGLSKLSWDDVQELLDL